jgi:phosphoribosylformylglycinamidine synthase
VRANRALYDICTAYGVPCISGKDSMKNDATIGGVKISIPPTLLFSLIARIPDVRKAVTMDVKRPGDLVYVLGTTYPELGASEYFRSKGFTGNSIPKVRIEEAAQMYKRLADATSRGLVASCHDCSDGGLAVCLAEKAFSGSLGMEIDLSMVPSEGVDRLDYLLFSESQSRFVLTASPENKSALEECLSGSPFSLVGEVTGSQELIMSFDGKIVASERLKDLKEAWQKPLRW